MKENNQLQKHSSSDLVNALRARQSISLSDYRNAVMEIAKEELQGSYQYGAQEFLEKARTLARENGRRSHSVLNEPFLESVSPESIYDELVRRSTEERQILWEQSQYENLPEDLSEASRLFRVYGDDSRIDVKDSSDFAVKAFRYSTVLVTTRGSLKSNEDGSFTLRTVPFHDSFNDPLCSGQRFYNQPSLVGMICSGVFVGPDLIATAGHCVTSFATGDLRCIRGFEMRDDNTFRLQFEPDRVYFGVEVIDYKATLTEDWALLRVRGTTTANYAAPVRRIGKIVDRSRVLALGHPSGLPLKAAYGVVTDNSGTHSFESDLDTFSGNSGSIVVSYDGNKRWSEGLLVRGQEDYIKVGDCLKVSVCNPPSCAGGESVQRFADFQAQIPR